MQRGQKKKQNKEKKRTDIVGDVEDPGVQFRVNQQHDLVHSH